MRERKPERTWIAEKKTFDEGIVRSALVVDRVRNLLGQRALKNLSGVGSRQKGVNAARWGEGLAPEDTSGLASAHHFSDTNHYLRDEDRGWLGGRMDQAGCGEPRSCVRTAPAQTGNSQVNTQKGGGNKEAWRGAWNV